jgi:hypothetical protein
MFVADDFSVMLSDGIVSDPEAGEVKMVIERKEHNDYYQDLTTSKTIRSLDC